MHEASDTLATDVDVMLVGQLGVDARRPVDAVGLLVDGRNAFGEGGVARARREGGRLRQA